MKKLTLFVAAIVMAIFSLKAQAPIQPGEMQLNAGLGLSTYGTPVYGGLEFGVANNISVGGEVSFRKYGKYAAYSPSITTIAAIGNYHFNELLDIPSQWDLYAGLSLGYSMWSDNNKYDYSWFKGSGAYFTGQIGGRYFFSDKFGVNLELGGGNYSGGKIGITLKI